MKKPKFAKGIKVKIKEEYKHITELKKNQVFTVVGNEPDNNGYKSNYFVLIETPLALRFSANEFELEKA